MSDISVIGLGAMGSALARTLLQNGYAVTVWNRTAEKAGPLVSAGTTAPRSSHRKAPGSINVREPTKD